MKLHTVSSKLSVEIFEVIPHSRRPRNIVVFREHFDHVQPTEANFQEKNLLATSLGLGIPRKRIGGSFLGEE